MFAVLCHYYYLLFVCLYFIILSQLQFTRLHAIVNIRFLETTVTSAIRVFLKHSWYQV